MSDSESIDSEVDSVPGENGVILRFLRQLLRSRPSSQGLHFNRPENESENMLYTALSECCYTVDSKDRCPSLLKGSDLELNVALSCGTALRRPKNLCTALRARELSSEGFPSDVMCGYLSTHIPNCKGVSEYNQSRIYVSRYSQDGTLFYVATQEGELTLYQVPSFRVKQQLQACEVGWAVISCTLDKSNSFLMYTTWSPSIHLYRLHEVSPSPMQIPLCPDYDRFAVFDAAFSDDSASIASTCSDGYLYISDVYTKERIQRVVAHEDHANACVFLDNSSQLLLTGGEDGLIRLWDRRGLSRERDTPAATFPGHIDSVTSLDVRYDERYFLSNSKDQSAKLWDVRCPGDVHAIECTKTAVSRQNWDYRWERAPHFLSDLRLRGDSSLCSYTGHKVQSTLIRAKFSPRHTTGSRYVYTGSHGRTSRAHVYDMLTGELVVRVGEHSSLIRDLDWHPYELWLNTSSWDGTWTQWKYGKHGKDFSQAQKYK